MQKHKSTQTYAHLASLITIIIWGTTFISTKLLLHDFKPLEILFYRFIMGLAILLIIYPRRLKIRERKHELYFAMAGFCGVTLYYLLENIALTYTSASSVGIILSISPFFTAILTVFLFKSKKSENLNARFFIGFALAITGVVLISIHQDDFTFSPKGSLLALAASFVWAVYSLITKKISIFGYNIIQTTRRIFTYGVAFMMPLVLLSDFNLNLSRLADKSNLLNLIYLGVGASALCFVTWNFALKQLGAVKTSIYIYMVPVITVTTAAGILKEALTPAAIAGTILATAGLIISEFKFKPLKRSVKNGY